MGFSLMVSIIILLQFFIACLQWNNVYIDISILIFPLLFFTLTVVFSIVKKEFVFASQYRDINTSVLQFRRNYRVFLGYQNLQSKVDCELPKNTFEVALGLSSAIKINIIVVTNPLCEMCNVSHFYRS